MKKVLLTLAVCLSFIGFAQAQLSEGETFKSTIVTGNRPEAGDWGLYLGPSFMEVRDLVNTMVSGGVAYGMPLINLKYYATDNLEIRGGIQYNGRTEKLSGDYDQEYWNGEDEIIKTIPVTDNYSYRRFRFSPGVAYHFSPKNILDVYVGGSIPLGVDAQESVYESERYLLEGDRLIKVDNIDNASYTSFVAGLSCFIGLQAFVADLPLAIGFEYGLTGMMRTGDEVYHVQTDYEGNLQKFYTTTGSFYDTHYNKLDCKSKYMGSDVRLTITYFFNNK
ncbi:MAG: hypothetical protein J6X40_05760 [Bacteroidales bacterium]|nr:hypothetical protein [Bacteroidales bacterium]